MKPIAKPNRAPGYIQGMQGNYTFQQRLLQNACKGFQSVGGFNAVAANSPYANGRVKMREEEWGKVKGPRH